MSRNYDNWERLVAAVVKREQIWQLCHQDSVSTTSSDYSLHLESSYPVYGDTFEFVRRLRQRNFRYTDLVRLPQAVLVSGRQYSATGTEAVIKLLDTVKIREDEFEHHMIVLENCVHENVAAPRAHRFFETTKLIVYDYHSQGSVYDMLHGDGCRPDWERRLRIAVGAALGIAHIHTQCRGELAHGNIKSSNIFVNSQGYGCVSDFGLAGIPGMPAKWWGALEYYRSPYESKSPSQESDVYSFGLLLIELVTGKLPVLAPLFANRLRDISEPVLLGFNGFKRTFRAVDELDTEGMASGEFPVDSDLETWCFEESLSMLEVAKRCLANLPQDRPTMSQLVVQLQNIRDTRLVKTDQIPQHKSGEKKRAWKRILRYQ